MTMEGLRRDKCKCGKNIVWNPHAGKKTKCKHCQTVYKIECDSVLVYWLQEIIDTPQPHQTEAR